MHVDTTMLQAGLLDNRIISFRNSVLELRNKRIDEIVLGLKEPTL